MPHPATGLAATLSALLRRCAARSLLLPGSQAHAQALANGLLPTNPTLQTDLILLYSRCSRFDLARHLLDQMLFPTLHSFNILLFSYALHSLPHLALRLFSSLLLSNLRPDHFTLPPLLKASSALADVSSGAGLHGFAIKLGLDFHLIVRSSIISMYAKLGCLEDAHYLFESMGTKDVVTWNSMVTGFARAGISAGALGLFRRMQFEVGEFDSMAAPSVLSVCARGGELRKGREVHGKVVRCLMFDCDVVIGNALIDMYAKCGCVEASRRVFKEMGCRNVVTWSSLISCYGVHGKGKEALKLYDEMIAQGIKPNCVTFTSVLSSCSHSGLLDDGWDLFDSMARVHGVEPSVEHYACMVDLLGRYGSINEAVKLIEGMPMNPLGSVWGALLSGCALHRNVEVGEMSALKLFELEPGNSSNYVVLCGLYEMVGNWDGVAKMRARMRELGVAKTPGCSWIDVDGRGRAFYRGDGSLPLSSRIHEILDWLWKTMAEPRSSDDTVPY